MAMRAVLAEVGGSAAGRMPQAHGWRRGSQAGGQPRARAARRDQSVRRRSTSRRVSISERAHVDGLRFTARVGAAAAWAAGGGCALPETS
eukprot:4681148-Prymnesium_polylepis.1